MNKFIVIEGLDGAGKSTQIELLQKFFEHNKINYKYLHFPRIGRGYYGDLIARFLIGDFGRLERIDPYIVSLIYAGDRDDAKKMIQGWLVNNFFIIVDRYVYSNIAFQCAKFHDEIKKRELERWIIDLEYLYNKIPKPDVSIYLNVPIHFIKKRLEKSRSGSDRAYLKGKNDIHESSIALQQNVQKEYLRLLKYYNDIISIDCASSNDSLLSPKLIHKKIMLKLKDL